MASALLERFLLDDGGAGSSMYLTELVAALWGASTALIEARTAAAARLAETQVTYTKSREALDRLAGAGSLGLNGWLARAGGLVAGFSATQIIAELAEHEQDVRIVANESGALFREIEIGLVSEMREPEFEVMLVVSLAVAVVAAVAVGAWLRWYRRRRVETLSAEFERVRCEAVGEIQTHRAEIVSRLVQTLVGVMERHYPGAAAAEIEAALGIPCSAADLLDGSREDVIRDFAARHIAADPLCSARAR